MDNQRLLAGACALLAIGVGLLLAWPRLTAIPIAALLVGGTFMAVTMANLRGACVAAPESTTAFITAALRCRRC